MSWIADRRNLLKTPASGAGVIAGMNALAGAKERAEVKEKVRRGL